MRRANSQPDPRNWLVPLAYATLIVAPAGAAVLGAHVVGDDLELLHRVRRRLHHLVREALVARAVGVVVDAVDQEVVERRAQAVDVERALAAAGGERRHAHARRQQRQRRVLAAVERQRPGLLAGDDLAAIARVGLQQHRARADFDLLGDLADGHRQIDALPGADRDLHVVDERDREAGLLGGDQIGADADGEELEVAVRVGHRSALTPVCVLVSVTLASGTTAPELSRTVPTTVAVSNCAKAGAASASSSSRKNRNSVST